MEPSEPSLAERARTLVAIARIGSLSTHSRKMTGYPFGSMMPYTADGDGRPVFFISSMAMHTQNLLGDSRSSLLITQPDVSGDPLGASRVTILGTSTHVTAEEVREVVDEAVMTAVDRLGFHLRLKSGDRVYGRRIAFIREVASRDDARSVLVQMVRHARTS